MKDHVYKLIELTGTSAASIEDAVDKAIKRAHKTLKNLCWFQVVETRGSIDKGKIGRSLVWGQHLSQRSQLILECLHSNALDKSGKSLIRLTLRT